jgi:uncharacterized protein (DUF2237 family)
MLRDDHGDQGRRPAAARNVFGEPLEICSIKPMTGFYRDGCCNTSQEDVGSHTVWAVMTAALEAVLRLKPPAIVVDKADKSDGAATNLCRQFGDFVVGDFWRTIENVKRAQGSQPLRLIGGNRE